MLKRERQEYILHQLNLHNKVLSNALCSAIEVSEDTIRRDLQQLAEKGKLIKVHGGALSPSFNQVDLETNKLYAKDSKRIIALKALKLVKDGMFVLTGGGTTILELAKALPENLRATFISGSIPAIAEYMRHPNIDVIVVGDKLSKHSRITFGSDAVNKIRSLIPDVCFLGVNAMNVANGVTDSDWDIVNIKQTMIQVSQKVVCVTISEKLDSVQPIKVCSLNAVDTLITELDPTDPKLLPYVQAGIEVL